MHTLYIVGQMRCILDRIKKMTSRFEYLFYTELFLGQLLFRIQDYR